MSVKQRLVTAEELLEYPTSRKNVEQIDWGGCRVSPPELSIRISSGWREAGCRSTVNMVSASQAPMVTALCSRDPDLVRMPDFRSWMHCTRQGLPKGNGSPPTLASIFPPNDRAVENDEGCRTTGGGTRQVCVLGPTGAPPRSLSDADTASLP